MVLSETETVLILDIPSTFVAPDSDEAQTVKLRNDDYQQVR